MRQGDNQLRHAYAIGVTGLAKWAPVDADIAKMWAFSEEPGALTIEASASSPRYSPNQHFFSTRVFSAKLIQEAQA